MSSSRALPQPLQPWRGPIPDALARAAVESLGESARASRELLAAGRVPLDVLSGMSLFLLTAQPRRKNSPSGKGAGAVAGGVWVREQCTVHRPVSLGEELVVSGESARRFTRRGRRYGVTTSETRAADGRRRVSNCTTGLLRYRPDPTAEDEADEGRPEAELPRLGPDPTHAEANPSRAALGALREGHRIGGEPAPISLDLMRLRDADRGDNPIHTDPEVARREGLAAPIAGGSHVLAFVFEALMREWGPEALLYGAHFDVRWKAPTHAGARIVPSAVIASVTPQHVDVDLEVRLESPEGPQALVGKLTLPIPGEAE